MMAFGATKVANPHLAIYTDIFSSVDQSINTLWFLPLIILFLPNLDYLIGAVRSVISSLSLSIMSRNLQVLLTSLVVLNLTGLIPFLFPITSRLWLAAVIGFIIWLNVLFTQFKILTTEMVAHLTPGGAPIALAPFLVLIETVSIIIRPLTLSVRLLANMTVGHVVCALVSVVLRSLTALWPLMWIMLGYTVFELGIAIIQAYIYTLLLTLYTQV